MNHLFVRGEGLTSPQEYEASGNVDLQVLEDIMRWVESTSKFELFSAFYSELKTTTGELDFELFLWIENHVRD